MSGPAKTGAIIYANNIKTLSEFYSKFFEMTMIRETNKFISLDANGLNIIIHVFPPEIPITSECRNTIKLFFTVSSLKQARNKIKELGGDANDEEWKNSIFSVCNVSDPEGNYIQLREFALK